MIFSRRSFWILVAVTLGVYLVMVFWSLPLIAEAAGGQTPFDMRPGGYSYDDAQAFLVALSPEGRAFYLSTQHKFDLIYPPLLGLMLGFALWHQLGGVPKPLRLISVLLCGAVTITDLWENALVAQMLRLDPTDLTTEIVAKASGVTVAKSTLTTIAMGLLLVAICVRALLRRKQRKDA
ncbi:hypothetical protein [Actibacterium pelagium]|uniref:Uncharacterized protein n=1 Tax=Actibacterium pelagium TaxID=2029103 RepID=A0A917EIP7_9RHOB|nr:hypothetical protein [Actibacterium pelagium]GGE39817.1 hypothetical protein GCM10011517_04450 [Actibacterium pelagium]